MHLSKHLEDVCSAEIMVALFSVSLTYTLQYWVFIRHWRSKNSQFTMKHSPANVRVPVTIFYSDEEPLSQYSSVTLHFSPATRILMKTLTVYVHA